MNLCPYDIIHLKVALSFKLRLVFIEEKNDINPMSIEKPKKRFAMAILECTIKQKTHPLGKDYYI